MNFIFFVPDELRAESVGCYGHPGGHTPNMDRFAAEGTRFEQCHVQHPVCTPSRCSFMTGWYPHVRGYRTLWHMLRPEDPNLLRYLKEKGYHVFWDGKNDLLAEECFEDSVSEWHSSGKGAFGKNSMSPEDPRYFSFQYDAYDGEKEDHGDYAKVQNAINFLRSKPEGPFAIYLPLIYPHCPYSAPKHLHGTIDPASIPPLRPAELEGKPDFHRFIRQYRNLDKVSDEDLRRINATYLEMTAFSDEIFGNLMDALEETGYADNTTTFLFADHGDWAGDFGLVEKWPSALDDTITRVPFIVKTPGGAKGHVVKEPVEMFDVMATTLELAGIKAKHTHFARSLTNQLNGEAGDTERIVFCEGGYDPHEPHCFEGHMGNPEEERLMKEPLDIYAPKRQQQQDHPESVCRSVMARNMTHKLVYRSAGACELYDMQKDPQELKNLYGKPEYADIQKSLEKEILDWYLRTADVTPLDEDPRGIPAAAG